MSDKLSPLEIVKELSKSIIALTNVQQCLLQLWSMVQELELRIQKLEDMNKKL